MWLEEVTILERACPTAAPSQLEFFRLLRHQSGRIFRRQFLPVTSHEPQFKRDREKKIARRMCSFRRSRSKVKSQTGQGPCGKRSMQILSEVRLNPAIVVYSPIIDPSLQS